MEILRAEPAVSVCSISGGGRTVFMNASAYARFDEPTGTAVFWNAERKALSV